MDENREWCGCLGVVLAQTRSKCDMKELGSDPDVDYYTDDIFSNINSLIQQLYTLANAYIAHLYCMAMVLISLLASTHVTGL